MKIDPNRPVNLIQVCVLCADGQVVLHDGKTSPPDELDREGSAFRELLRKLDPNRHYITAFILDDADRDVFFRAREVARQSGGRHMQATVETPDRQRSLWESYKTMKRMADAEVAKDDGEDFDASEGDEP